MNERTVTLTLTPVQEEQLLWAIDYTIRLRSGKIGCCSGSVTQAEWDLCRQHTEALQGVRAQLEPPVP